jgi:hypothetical protein
VPRFRSSEDVRAVLRLKADGRTDRDISRLTGIPVTTIRLWRNRGLSNYGRDTLESGEPCPICGSEPHDFVALPREAYSYLLALYLGDGYISRSGTSWSLRIALDEAYPGIIEELL